MGKSTYRPELGWTAALLLALTPAQDAVACAFHGYIPDPTLVDMLLETEQAVIARPNASGNYDTIDALLGPDLGTIPIAASAAFRTATSQDSGATVLLVRDGAYGPWTEAALLDTRYRSVIDTVIENQSAWQMGRDSERRRLFASLVNDPNPDLQRLALQELDRLPYPTLKDLRVPPLRNLMQDIETGDPDQRPIRILLAGLSGDRSFAAPLATALHNAVLQDTAHLGAYVTALIELQGQPAVEAIVAHYLKPGLVTQSVQDKLLDALALQYRAARSATRRSIAREVAALVRHNPAMADRVIAQFGPQTSGRLLP